jgi:hypothetical protein
MCLDTKRTASRTLKNQTSLIPMVKVEDESNIPEQHHPSSNSLKPWNVIAILVMSCLLIWMSCSNIVKYYYGVNLNDVLAAKSTLSKEPSLLSPSLQPYYEITRHAPFLVPLHKTIIGGSHFEKMWSEVIIKPLLLEVGLMIIFQTASVPLARLVIRKGYRHRGWRRFLTKHFWWRRKALTPRVVLQRILHSIRRLYKRRSRLSAASDMTHVLGDEE